MGQMTVDILHRGHERAKSVPGSVVFAAVWPIFVRCSPVWPQLYSFFEYKSPRRRDGATVRRGSGGPGGNGPATGRQRVGSGSGPAAGQKRPPP